jgi:hypothetical protein
MQGPDRRHIGLSSDYLPAAPTTWLCAPCRLKQKRKRRSHPWSSAATKACTLDQSARDTGRAPGAARAVNALTCHVPGTHARAGCTPTRPALERIQTASTALQAMEAMRSPVVAEAPPPLELDREACATILKVWLSLICASQMLRTVAAPLQSSQSVRTLALVSELTQPGRSDTRGVDRSPSAQLRARGSYCRHVGHPDVFHIICLPESSLGTSQRAPLDRNHHESAREGGGARSKRAPSE